MAKVYLVKPSSTGRLPIYRWYRSGKFPAPHYIGVRRVWWLQEIITWEQTSSPRRRPSANFKTDRRAAVRQGASR